MPYLKFGGEAPLSVDAFLDECEKWLTPADMETLLASRDALDEWKTFDKALRADLASARRARKNNETYKTSAEIKRVLSMETPLLRERALEELRWKFIEDISASCFFDLKWLMFYFLKLRMLERLTSFNKDRGEKIFHDMCEVKNEKAFG